MQPQRALKGFGKPDLGSPGGKGRSAKDSLAAALEHHRAGNLDRACRIYRKILRKDAAHAEALHLLGLAVGELGRPERAAQLVAKAVAADPGGAGYRHSLGVLLRTLGRPEEAIDSFRAALEIQPRSAMTLTALGNALKALGRFDEAADFHRRALEVDPDCAEILSNLGVTYKEAGRLEEAVECLRDAVAMHPDHPELHYNLGNACLAAARFEDAEGAFQSAVAIAPRHARALSNLGVALREQGRPGEAATCFQKALEIVPNYAEAHWNLGLALLMTGDFDRGWPEYEWRRRLPNFAMRRHHAPAWDGGALEGRSLLVHAEQALGDTIQFARYVSMAANAGGRVLLQCPSPLARLLSGLAGPDEIITCGEEPPPFDLHAPLMSLPGLLDPKLEKAAAMVPYLGPEAALAEQWRARLGQTGELRVGICWQGNPAYRADRRRSVPLGRFAALARLDGVRLISLQKGFGTEQLAKLPGDVAIEDLGPALDEDTGAFVDTAAVIQSLDLVIASDTAVPHLAGALGAEVWLLLPFAPDWRWMLERGDSPWYPTMRLFRQSRPGDWKGVFDRVIGELRQRLP
jgi:tetratricopeptide (TPR) repeat protein